MQCPYCGNNPEPPLGFVRGVVHALILSAALYAPAIVIRLLTAR